MSRPSAHSALAGLQMGGDGLPGGLLHQGAQEGGCRRRGRAPEQAAVAVLDSVTRASARPFSPTVTDIKQSSFVTWIGPYCTTSAGKNPVSTGQTRPNFRQGGQRPPHPWGKGRSRFHTPIPARPYSRASPILAAQLRASSNHTSAAGPPRPHTGTRGTGPPGPSGWRHAAPRPGGPPGRGPPTPPGFPPGRAGASRSRSWAPPAAAAPGGNRSGRTPPTGAPGGRGETGPGGPPAQPQS